MKKCTMTNKLVFLVGSILLTTDLPANNYTMPVIEPASLFAISTTSSQSLDTLAQASRNTGIADEGLDGTGNESASWQACIQGVQKCQQNCEEWYKHNIDYLVSCRTRCGNTGSCNNLKK